MKKIIKVRVSEGEERAIRAAAQANRMSISAFVARAALEAAKPWADRALPTEGEYALGALKKVGYSRAEAEAAIRAVLKKAPDLNAEQIIACILGGKSVEEVISSECE